MHQEILVPVVFMVRIQQSNPTFFVEGETYAEATLTQQLDSMQFANNRRGNYGQRRFVRTDEKWRRQIHAYPEAAFEEVRTAELVAAQLAEMGYDVVTGVGETGVVASLKNGDNKKVIIKYAKVWLALESTREYATILIKKSGQQGAPKQVKDTEFYR